MEKFKRISRDLVAKGAILDYYQDTMQIPNGNIAKWDLIDHKGAAAVVAVREDGKLLMVRQYRYALKEELWELPAGKLEKDEDPFEAAKRELEEECGVTAERFINLGVLYPTVGYDSEKIYIWAAKGLKPTSQHLDDGEFLDVAGLPFDDVLEMVMTDEIRDSKTVTAMLKYAWLRQRGEG